MEHASHRRTVVRLSQVLVLAGALAVLSLVPATVASASSSLSPYATAVLADHPVSYWRLNDAPGSSVAADQESLNPGAIGGSPTFQQPGPSGITDGAAIEFTGGQWIDVGSNLMTANLWSVEVWFKLSSSQVAPCATGPQGPDTCSIWIDGGGFGDGIEVRKSGQLAGIVWADGCCTRYEITSPQSYADGAWHYAVLTRNSSSFTLYIDGVAVESTPTGASTTYYGSNPPAGATIDNDPPHAEPGFEGDLSEVAYYNYALSATQVAAHYAAAGGGAANCPQSNNPEICARSFTATVGTVGTFVVAEYADYSNCNQTPPPTNPGNNGRYTVASVTINWGDGTPPTSGTARTGTTCPSTFGSGETEPIEGTHDYQQSGTYTVSVSLTYVRGSGNTFPNCATWTPGDTTYNNLTNCIAIGAPVQSTATVGGGGGSFLSVADQPVQQVVFVHGIRANCADVGNSGADYSELYGGLRDAGMSVYTFCYDHDLAFGDHSPSQLSPGRCFSDSAVRAVR